MLQQNNKLENMLSNYFQMNKPPSSSPLPRNTVTNPKGLKAITTQSGVSYDGPPIPPPFSSSPKVVEREPEVTKDPVQPSTEKVQPPDVQPQAPTSEPVNAPKPKPDLPYPSRHNNQKLREKIVECLALADLGASINLMPLYIWRKLSLLELTPTQMILELADRSTTRPTGIVEDVFMRVRHERFYSTRVSDEAITFKVGNTSRYSYNDAESINRIDVIDVACEEYSQEVLGFSGNSESGNPTPTSEPIITKSSPSLTPFEGGDFILEEIETYLASDSVSPGIDEVNSEDISKFFSTFPIPVENSDFFLEKTETFLSFPELETFRFDSEEKNSGSTTIHADVSLLEYDCFYSEGDIRLLEKFLNNDPSSPLPPKEIKTVELKSEKIFD
ncbi:reverse transcriptase domain-containing protein [Tanacetum coccineum]